MFTRRSVCVLLKTGVGVPRSESRCVISQVARDQEGGDPSWMQEAPFPLLWCREMGGCPQQASWKHLEESVVYS